jgi:hypothetical protein
MSGIFTSNSSSSSSSWLVTRKQLDNSVRMQNSFHHIIRLNNDAVHFFELRHFEEAKSLFRQAADKATSLLQDLSQGEETSVGKSSNPIHAGWSISPKFKKSSDITKHEVFTLFRTVLLRPQQITTSLLKACLSILLYNLAVTLHIHVTAHLHPSSSAFEYTSKLYEMSLRILKESKYDCDDSLLLCMFNNAGALFFSEMVKYEDAQECFLAVSMLLTLGRRDGLKTLLSKAELIEILLNLYIQQVRCAPAA